MEWGEKVISTLSREARKGGKGQCVCECVSMCVCVCLWIHKICQVLPVVVTRSAIVKPSEGSRDPQLESVQVRLPGCWPALFCNVLAVTTFK